MGWMQAILAGVGAVNEISDNAKATKAAVAEQQENKKQALEAAADAVARGGREAGQARLAGTQLIARQKVAYANSGVDPSVGTAADVMADTRMYSDLDAKTIENNAAREAWGFRRYGLKYGQQATLEAARGSSRAAATALTGASRVVSGVSSAFN